MTEIVTVIVERRDSIRRERKKEWEKEKKIRKLTPFGVCFENLGD